MDAIALATPAELARLVALDTWLEVLDRRKPDGVWNLLIDNSNVPSRLVVIDYGFSLSGPLHPGGMLGGGEITPQFPKELRLALSEPDMDGACDEISTINPADLQTLVQSFPADWGIADDTRQAILNYLTSRRADLKPCLRRALQQ